MRDGLRIRRLLVANRGEIACRIMRTCRRLGIETMAVHSAADARARHVREADTAVAIGGPAPAESYLDGTRIIAAALAAGVDAIHPGYGFLSENAGFARACADAGLVFVGPRAETIRRMGSKSEAKAIMEDAGVPVVPGYHGAEQSPEELAARAAQIGFPLLIKPSAGGGGKGMRVVRAVDQFADALAAARRESMKAFGDERVILERYIERPRHIEVQVFGDRHGNIIHLWERECSTQRRYQKVIEESPSPLLDEPTRLRMVEAAVEAAAAVEYVNAGTVEFIVSPASEFWFMEMNTRLQVEHPVTEMVTGLDLVEWQLRIASGEPLPLAQAEIPRRGHAIEARIYAEDPASNFMPSTGRVRRLRAPDRHPAIRLDSGIEQGDMVSHHYDPLLAKLIVHGLDRNECVERLREALAHTAIAGVATNLPLLRALAAHPVFSAGQVDTGFLDRELENVLWSVPEPPLPVLAAAAWRMSRELPHPAAPEDPWSPWAAGDGWRPAGAGGLPVRLLDAAGRRHVLRLEFRAAGVRVHSGSHHLDVVLEDLGEGRLHIDCKGLAGEALVTVDTGRVYVGFRDHGWDFAVEPLHGDESSQGEQDTRPVAPMPGTIVALKVGDGDRVAAGQPLLIMEGMKMELTIVAPVAGVVARVLCAAGDSVDADAVLVDLQPEEAP
ncbi:MAG TPA: acetyl/propionyl/methylcrotonyl-CoA carboxylase subunit alpha [Gammaproteobacteria bacterium]|nr:acetyl/propionyl/methylcrotonyl-CoA carboxylase subunit alpha [Gammaproteobacteria bacterium]